MAVRIRLRRMGRKKQPHYRIVVADSASPRDGRFVESLGYYKPLSEPARLVLDMDRVDHWLSEGASPSGTVKNLIDRARKGGDGKVVVGPENVEARKEQEAEELKKRRAAEKKAEAEAAAEAEAKAAKAAKAAEEATAEVPEDVAESPEGSSAADATPAEAKAEGEEEAVEAAEADDETPAAAKAEGAEAGGEVKTPTEEEAPEIDASVDEAAEESDESEEK